LGIFQCKIERNQRQPTKHLIKNIADFFSVNEKELLEEFLSDQIAYKILDEEADLSILKVAEEKVAYIKTLRNE
jgi:transcriptional regulator with XRE-family HTH domain